MTSTISVIGGIGFFLLGMSLMAGGLKAIAGDTLKKLLNRFTGGTLSSINTGMVITLLVQSSTATTLMTIGFVSAGMLTFLQATGVIFGANLGTTSTGWLVAFIGLKFSVSQLALPLIGVGVLLNQFSKGKLAQSGLVIAGFGLLFIGIQFLQDGMAGLNRYIDLSAFAGPSIWSRLVLVLIGIVMTVIMQSSSAAVATTITVLAAGTIELEQAIALVVGQNIGTTATAAFAAIGASVPAKRTAMAHILFNAFTGLLAFLIFPLLIRGLSWMTELLGWRDPAMTLALFHTAFSLLGIAVFAPLIRQFTAVIEWLLPEKKSTITMHLDTRIAMIPAVAIETALRALKEASQLTVSATLGKLAALMPGPHAYRSAAACDEELLTIHHEIDEIRSFVANIRADSPQASAHYISALHALDHVARLNRLVRTGFDGIRLANSANEPYTVVTQLQEQLAAYVEALQQSNLPPLAEQLSAYSQELATFRKQERANTFDVTATGEVPITEAFHYVQLILLIDGLAYHLWRLTVHLSDGIET